MAMKPLAEKEEVIFCKNPETATILNVSGRAKLTDILEQNLSLAQVGFLLLNAETMLVAGYACWGFFSLN